jgi:hypothetical protein
MYSRRPSITFSVIFYTLVTCISFFAGVSRSLADGFPVEQVIEAIKYEINGARLAREKQDVAFKIASVDVVLTAVAKYEGDLGIKLEIPVVEKIGDVWGSLKGKLENTQKISLTFKPEGGAVHIGGSANLGLLPAIVSVKSAMRAAAAGDLRLGLQTFKFEVQCVVTRTAEGGIKFLFMDTAAAYENLAVQYITIFMEPAS